MIHDVANTAHGEPVSTLVRADMVYFETPNGGAVFFREFNQLVWKPFL